MAAMLLGGARVAGNTTTAVMALHHPRPSYFLPPRPRLAAASWSRLRLQTAPRSSQVRTVRPSSIAVAGE
jgi:hypothetical protein